MAPLRGRAEEKMAALPPGLGEGLCSLPLGCFSSLSDRQAADALQSPAVPARGGQGCCGRDPQSCLPISELVTQRWFDQRVGMPISLFT